MKRELDIHNYGKKLQAALRQLESAEISDRNKQLILQFRDSCIVEGIGVPRVARFLGVLKSFAEVLGKDFDRAVRSDIERLVRVIQERPYAPWTKVSYKAMLKRFYKWLKGGNERYPDEVRWLKARLAPTEKRLPANGELLTLQDVDKLVRSAGHPRDRAFVSLLYESGSRISIAPPVESCSRSIALRVRG